MATIPSIAMIPSGYKANKVYSVLPTDGSGDLVTARTTKATRVNSDGLIEEVAIGVPRLDYTDGGCPSLLLEGNSTNLITYSEDYSNAYWTKSGATVTSGFSAPSVDSPLGAFKLVEDSSNGLHRIRFTSIPRTSGSTYTISIYAKPNGRLLYLNGATFCNASSTFDLSNGTIANEASGTSKIELLSSGYYKCSVTGTATITGSTNFFIQLNNTEFGDDSYQGDGTSGVYIFGSQLEEQSSATSYIKTEGTTISRTLDSASKSGISSLINSTQGVFYAEISSLSNTVNSNYISISDGTYDNRISIFYSVGTNIIRAFLRVGGVSQVDLSVAVSDITAFHQVAFKFSTNDFAIWVDGVEVFTDVSGSTFAPNTLDRLHFGEISGTTNPFKGNCKDLRIYKTILSDAELTTLTTL